MNLIGNLIRVFRPAEPPLPEPGPATEARTTHAYKVTRDGLAPTAGSLEEFYDIQETRHQAREIFRTMQYAEELLSEDQSPLDQDARKGHVRLPGFEAHPDSGFQIDQGEVQISGSGARVQTTSVSDNWMATNQSGIWNKTDQTFTLSYQPKAVPEFPSSPEHKIQDETFPVGGENRAGDLIKAAEFWESKARSLDNTIQDINEKPDQVVAPGMAVGQIGSEPIMSETFYIEDSPRPFEVYDLEQTARGTIVAGNRESGGRAFGARLTTSRSPESREVVLERPEIGTIEKVEWVISDGVLHYEKYKKG